MKFLINMRIRNKIIFIILVIGILSTITGSVISYLYFIHNTKKQLISNTLLQARLISEYCGLPMEFNYPDNAIDALQKLHSIPDIYDGILFTLNDSVFASYHKSNYTIAEIPVELKKQNYFFEGNYLHVVNPVIYKGKKYGYVYLRSNINWESILRQQSHVLLISFSVMLVLIVLLAFFLQGNISRPIIRFTQKMNLVARNKDYSIRFKNSGKDEIGEMYASFNTLLSEIKKSESELKTTLNSLTLSEERFRNLSERIPIPICLLNLSGDFTYRNQSFYTVFGYAENETFTFQDWTHKVFVDKGYKKIIQNFWNLIILRAKSGKSMIEPTEFRIRSKKGQKLVVEIAGVIMENSILLTFIDLTERKLAEELLKEKSEQIELQNQTLTQTNKELLQAKERAEESDRLKTAFLQNMSHEIRSPMNAIMGFADLLTEQYNNKEKLEQYAQIITQRSNDLLHIINDILDIAKIESGQLDLKIEPCNLKELFDELSLFFSEQQQKIQKTHINFNIKSVCAANQIVIMTDKVKLSQVFINLIGNAFKFTDEGTIEVGCKSRSEKEILFYVSDTGIGIPEDMKDLVFDRFVQVNQKTNRVYGGTGLGLSIVKGLVELMGGTLWLDSRPGKGTIFYFTIPYHEARVEKTESPDPSQKPVNFGDKQILVVEDDEYNFTYLNELLTAVGLKVLSAGLGNEGVQIAIEQPVDLVLMDIRLPDIDGFNATAQIKQIKPGIKIIAQTAYASPEDRQKALEAGCDDFISKPINRDALIEMLTVHLCS